MVSRSIWAAAAVRFVQSQFADGITFDYESPIPSGSSLGSYYAALIAETRKALHTARRIPAAAPCAPVLPLSQRKKNHIRGNIWSFTVG